MINSISIKNFTIIDFIDIEFHRGFTAITGETGSGKSILIEAIKLLMGQRADSNQVGPFGTKCILEATFNISDYSLQNFFSKNDLDYDMQNTILRREINNNGKSRAFINDSPVNLAVLKSLGACLLDIHSQHQTLLLNESFFQTDLVDSITGSHIKTHDSLIQSFREEHKSIRSLETRIDELKIQNEASNAQSEYFNFLIKELDDACLRPGEQKRLEDELNLIQNKALVVDSLSELHDCIDGEEYTISSLIEKQLKNLLKLSNSTESYTYLYERLNSVHIELSDISKECHNLLSTIEHNSLNINEVEQRLNTLYNLQNKHKVNSLEELIRKHQELKGKMDSEANISVLLKSLSIELKGKKKILDQLAGKINSNRLKVIPKIESIIVQKLKSLGIRNSQFEIHSQKINRYDYSCGAEITFMFSANKGVKTQKLSKVASGGESARLMLCLKSLLAQHQNLPCLILDEIDTGISGEIAAKVAKELKEISSKMQLIVISHLPQVAASAKRHIEISKTEDKGKTISEIKYLDEKERIMALTKMLSGESLSDAAIENAKALLQLSH